MIIIVEEQIKKCMLSRLLRFKLVELVVFQPRIGRLKSSCGWWCQYSSKVLPTKVIYPLHCRGGIRFVHSNGCCLRIARSSCANSNLLAPRTPEISTLLMSVVNRLSSRLGVVVLGLNVQLLGRTHRRHDLRSK